MRCSPDRSYSPPCPCSPEWRSAPMTPSGTHWPGCQLVPAEGLTYALFPISILHRWGPWRFPQQANRTENAYRSLSHCMQYR